MSFALLLLLSTKQIYNSNYPKQFKWDTFIVVFAIHVREFYDEYIDGDLLELNTCFLIPLKLL
jgi:hypothetical protein